MTFCCPNKQNALIKTINYHTHTEYMQNIIKFGDEHKLSTSLG
ncbi:hypothetical protein SALWKB12_0843 [Snodgrassella communis]|uniref:Uncharacterized protein n=1 Tax=Snodgrassella communis TaxID=2946699 RepID=A0A836Z3W7_9NEIS|nr:hypothetical protein SALWKB12_0843 [Snodgrassella communis]KDN13973.1 hypothetical protein SALWKB29_1965 [Snodgrassella communis]